MNSKRAFLALATVAGWPAGGRFLVPTEKKPPPPARHTPLRRRLWGKIQGVAESIKHGPPFSPTVGLFIRTCTFWGASTCWPASPRKFSYSYGRSCTSPDSLRAYRRLQPPPMFGDGHASRPAAWRCSGLYGGCTSSCGIRICRRRGDVLRPLLLGKMPS